MFRSLVVHEAELEALVVCRRFGVSPLDTYGRVLLATASTPNISLSRYCSQLEVATDRFSCIWIVPIASRYLQS